MKHQWKSNGYHYICARCGYWIAKTALYEEIGEDELWYKCLDRIAYMDCIENGTTEDSDEKE